MAAEYWKRQPASPGTKFWLRLAGMLAAYEVASAAAVAMIDYQVMAVPVAPQLLPWVTRFEAMQAAGVSIATWLARRKLVANRIKERMEPADKRTLN